MELTKCDRCGKTGEKACLRGGLRHPHDEHLPKGWSTIMVGIESTLMIDAAPIMSVRQDGGDFGVDKERPAPGTVEHVPTVVQSYVDLCPDCTNMFILAAGMDKLIKRDPDPDLHFPHQAPPRPPWYPPPYVVRPR
jgi:hypothetical protein